LINKKWNNQYFHNPEASEFHELFRTFILTEPRLRNLRWYQEVNVKDLIPDYEYTSHHYDWYLYEIDLIVELHGQQHYQVTNFGSISADDALVNYRNMLYRDNLKRTTALEKGFLYAVIPYKDRNRISHDLIFQLAEEPFDTRTNNTRP
jgi:hypothetical protein